VLIIGAGFAGFHCARQLERKLEAHEAEVALVTPRNYLIYSPLLPQVAAGWLSPMAVAIPLRRTLHRTILVPGAVIGLDLDARACVVRTITGETRVERYDLLVLAPGNVTRTFNIPGLERYARGMKMLAEAVYLHDHVLAQVELADAASSEQERIERCTFVVVGGGYSGTETAAALHRASMRSLPRFPHLRPDHIRWILVDAAPQIMPELGAKLGQEALGLLERNGLEVVLQTSVEEVTETTVRLSGGRTIPSRTLVWTAGAAANPLIDTLGLTTVRGRLAVTPELAVPGRADTFALGDAAAVPDLAAGQDAVCPPTAQHAQRQGKAAARNVLATLRGEPLQPYRHKDLGLVVDLGGTQAVARPLGVPLTGLAAQAVTRGYHMLALPRRATQARVGAEWLLHALAGGGELIRLGFLAERTGTLADFEHTDAGLNQEETQAALTAAGEI
jgi:NADH dehydrogenase